jgi:hypothetical protein
MHCIRHIHTHLLPPLGDRIQAILAADDFPITHHADNLHILKNRQCILLVSRGEYCAYSPLSPYLRKRRRRRIVPTPSHLVPPPPAIEFINPFKADPFRCCRLSIIPWNSCPVNRVMHLHITSLHHGFNEYSVEVAWRLSSEEEHTFILWESPNCPDPDPLTRITVCSILYLQIAYRCMFLLCDNSKTASSV